MSKQQKKLSVSAEALKKAEKLCEINGLKLTKLRKQVLKLIWKKPGYVKAYDLLDELKKIDPSAKPPTIYRTLDFLIENGFVHKLNSINSFVGCFHPKAHKECYFLICKKCNIYQECCDDSLKDRISKTAIHNNFVISNTTLEIEGHCLDCSQK